jgi:hypothetical protein
MKKTLKANPGEENKNLIEILLKKGILRPSEYLDDYLVYPGNNPGDIQFVSVKKISLESLIKGSAKELIIDIYEYKGRESQYNDCVSDDKYFSGKARITFDKGNLVLNTEVTGEICYERI